MKIWLVAVAALLSWAMTGTVRRYALASNLLDVPNDRSSHDIATPRGGGIAICAAVFIGSLGLWATGEIATDLLIVILGGGSAIAIAGFVDDRRGLSARTRLIVHALAAILCVHYLGTAAIPVPTGLPGATAARFMIAVLAVMWSINLFNFMDGSDGIAGAQAAFVCTAAALLYGYEGTSTGDVSLLLVVAGSSLGFLAWNLPPARIFMGDVGSGFLGFVLAAFALHAAVPGTAPAGAISIWTWLILHASFTTDATVTLVVRALRRERLYAAHRSHAYQHLARRWRSHRRVLALYALVNLLWLLPLAVASVARPRFAGLFAVCAMLPLAVAALALGAGNGRSKAARQAWAPPKE